MILKKQKPNAQLLWIGTWNPDRDLRFRDELAEMVKAGDLIITGPTSSERTDARLSQLAGYLRSGLTRWGRLKRTP